MEPLLPGMVPEYEEMAAAKHGGVPWPAWEEMERWQRIDLVAAFRLDRLMEMHEADALNSHMEQRRHLGA